MIVSYREVVLKGILCSNVAALEYCWGNVVLIGSGCIRSLSMKINRIIYTVTRNGCEMCIFCFEIYYLLCAKNVKMFRYRILMLLIALNIFFSVTIIFFPISSNISW